MKKIQLSIPEPCHENWQGMTPNEQGRFCGSCQKTVVDFTSMSDSQLIAFFKEPKASVCGRLMPDQLDRDISQPKKRLPWLRYFFTIALPAFLLQLKSSAQVGRVKRIEKTECSPTLKGDTVIFSKSSLPDLYPALQGYAGGLSVRVENFTEVSGQIRDHNGEPVPFASVYVKGQDQYLRADSAGQFTVKGKKLKGKTLVISSVGFLPIEKKIDGFFMDITFENPTLSGEVVLVGAVVRKPAKPIPLIKRIVDTAFSRFSIYPNPAAVHSTLTINTQKLERGSYVISLINSGGEIVYNEQKKIEAKEQELTIPLRAVAAGTYYVSLFNTRTAKSYSEKLVVQ